jgi:hypothetical protein
MTKSELAIGVGLVLILVGILRHKEAAWLGMGIATGGYIALVADNI